MERWQEVFPSYNLKSNKGYSTPDHKRALRDHGPTSLHRFSFEPVRMNCSERWWSGYKGEPLQEELFDQLEAEVR
jgi:ribonuclease HII